MMSQQLPLPGEDAVSRPAEISEHLPGDLAIWIFILAELLVFGVFFAAYGFTRLNNIELFDTYQRTLDRQAGMVNTLLLIAGSFFVARAVAAARADTSRRAAHWLAWALVAGGGFLAVKLAEYAAKFSAGINLSTNTFYMFYISLTFFHFMHVILGMVILFVLMLNARRGRYGPANMNGMESGASYWHMVDLVWIVLFPLVYLLR
jgi:nitric oxide reductase NorE protein